MHIPAAAHIINFVVLTAALSSMNCNLYLATRMVFSLSRAGYAPALLGHVSRKGTPIPALLFSAIGLGAATAFAIWFPGTAYVYMFGIALFGGLFVWMMVFVTHLSFRKHWQAHGGRRLPVTMPLFPWTTIAGGVAGARHHSLDVVGRRHAGHAGSRRSLAAGADRRLLCLGTPASKSGGDSRGPGCRSK